MTYFITIACCCWPFPPPPPPPRRGGGWDQSQIRAFDGICLDTALAALAQLRQIAIRNALTGVITLPAAPAGDSDGQPGDLHAGAGDAEIEDADLRIPFFRHAPVPARAGQRSPAPSTSAPSSCPSPKPPGSPPWPGNTPPG